MTERTGVLRAVESDGQSSAYEPNFLDFYAMYPRKVARKDAERAWRRLTRAEQVAALVGLVQWRRVWEWEASRREDFMDYLPYPASWLNGARWEDELPRAFRQTTPPSGGSTGAHPRSPDEQEGPRQPIPQFVMDAIARLKR